MLQPVAIGTCGQLSGVRWAGLMHDSPSDPANGDLTALAHKTNMLSTICTTSPNNSNNNNNKTDSTALLTASSTFSVLAERGRC